MVRAGALLQIMLITMVSLRIAWLCQSGVAIDSTGVYIVDTFNNRVLYYAGTSTVATRVYGQGGSFTTNTLNYDGIAAAADSFYGVQLAVAVDSTGVYIADYGNNRVLYYAGTSTVAARVYGQGGSFTTNTANYDGICAPLR